MVSNRLFKSLFFVAALSIGFKNIWSMEYQAPNQNKPKATAEVQPPLSSDETPFQSIMNDPKKRQQAASILYYRYLLLETFYLFQLVSSYKTDTGYAYQQNREIIAQQVCDYFKLYFDFLNAADPDVKTCFDVINIMFQERYPEYATLFTLFDYHYEWIRHFNQYRKQKKEWSAAVLLLCNQFGVKGFNQEYFIAEKPSEAFVDLLELTKLLLLNSSEIPSFYNQIKELVKTERNSCKKGMEVTSNLIKQITETQLPAVQLKNVFKVYNLSKCASIELTVLLDQFEQMKNGNEIFQDFFGQHYLSCPFLILYANWYQALLNQLPTQFLKTENSINLPKQIFAFNTLILKNEKEQAADVIIKLFNFYNNFYKLANFEKIVVDYINTLPIISDLTQYNDLVRQYNEAPLTKKEKNKIESEIDKLGKKIEWFPQFLVAVREQLFNDKINDLIVSKEYLDQHAKELPYIQVHTKLLWFCNMVKQATTLNAFNYCLITKISEQLQRYPFIINECMLPYFVAIYNFLSGDEATFKPIIFSTSELSNAKSVIKMIHDQLLPVKQTSSKSQPKKKKAKTTNVNNNNNNQETAEQVVATSPVPSDSKTEITENFAQSTALVQPVKQQKKVRVMSLAQFLNQYQEQSSNFVSIANKSYEDVEDKAIALRVYRGIATSQAMTLVLYNACAQIEHPALYDITIDANNLPKMQDDQQHNWDTYHAFAPVVEAYLYYGTILHAGDPLAKQLGLQLNQDTYAIVIRAKQCSKFYDAKNCLYDKDNKSIGTNGYIVYLINKSNKTCFHRFFHRI